MLLLAIPSIWPYGFYQLLRWIVCSIGLFNAYTAHEQGLKMVGGDNGFCGNTI